MSRESSGEGQERAIAGRPAWGVRIASLSLLVMITIGAAYLRLERVAGMGVTPEQLTLLRLAARAVNMGMLPLAGHETAGIVNPPFSLYLLALPLRSQATLWAAFSFQAWLGALAIPVLYLAGGRVFGRLVGVLAAFFLAFLPWTVAADGPSLFLTVLALAGLLFYLAGGTRRGAYLELAGVALAALTQRQWDAWLLLPVVALLLVIYRRPGSLRPFLIGLLLFFLTYLPYLAFEQPRAFLDLRAGWHGLLPGDSSLSAVAGYNLAVSLWPAFCLLLAVLLDKSLIYARSKLTGGAVRWLTAGGILLLGVLALWSVTTGPVIVPAAGGRSLKEIDALVSLSRQHLAANPDCSLLVLGEGNHADSSPVGFLAEFAHPSEVRFVEQGRGFILPEGCFLYLLAGDDLVAEAWLQANGRLLPGAWPFYQVDAGKVASAGRPLAVWRNGLALMDYRVEGTAAPGQQLVVHYTWHVIQQPRPGQHFHFFSHFLNPEGQIVTQEDDPGVHTAYWRPGDVLMTRYYLNLPADLPAGSYTVQTGVYTWPELRRVRLQRSEETIYLLAPPIIAEP